MPRGPTSTVYALLLYMFSGDLIQILALRPQKPSRVAEAYYSLLYLTQVGGGIKILYLEHAEQ